MAGRGEPDRLGVGIDDREQERRRAPALELLDEAVHALEDQRRAKSFERVSAHRALEVRHPGRGLDTAPDDVADHQADASVAQRDGVVPVAADASLARTGQVAGGEP